MKQQSRAWGIYHEKQGDVYFSLQWFKTKNPIIITTNGYKEKWETINLN